MLVETGFVDIQISQPYDTFGDARGKRRPGSSMFTDTRSSLVSLASILSESSVA